MELHLSYLGWQRVAFIRTWQGVMTDYLPLFYGERCPDISLLEFSVSLVLSTLFRVDWKYHFKTTILYALSWK